MRTTPCLLVLPLLLAGCASGGGAGSSPTGGTTDPASLMGTWTLDQGSLASLVQIVPMAANVTIAFRDGHVSGDSGCNRYGGTYDAKVGGSIAFGQLAATLMACTPDRSALQDAYLAALGSVTSFEVEGTLFLRGNESSALTFHAETSAAPMPLLTTAWTLTGIGSGGATSSIVAGTEITLVLGQDGTASGSAGCNAYRASYTSDGQSLTFGPLATTRKMCEADVMTQEHAFTEAMANVRGSAIDGTQLTLNDEQGSTLLTFEGAAG